MTCRRLRLGRQGGGIMAAMTWRAPLIVVAAGCLIFGGGLLYGVFSVGVPTQDPTPEIFAYEKRVEGVSGWIMGTGLTIGLTGLLWGGAVRLSRAVR